MDAPCKIQGSIHVFRLVNNMCPGKWVHIITERELFLFCIILFLQISPAAMSFAGCAGATSLTAGATGISAMTAAAPVSEKGFARIPQCQ